MGYTEVRMQREIHQLRREVREAKAREAQTRQGCLDLVHALAGLVTGLGATGASAAPGFKEVADRAAEVFAPDPAVA